jgi:hypothetical protein
MTRTERRKGRGDGRRETWKGKVGNVRGEGRPADGKYGGGMRGEGGGKGSGARGKVAGQKTRPDVKDGKKKRRTPLERWHACLADPGCRAEMFRLAVWVTMVYTAFGFLAILFALWRG